MSINSFFTFIFRGNIFTSSFKFTWLLLYPVIYSIGWFVTLQHDWVLINFKLMMSTQESRSFFVLFFLFCQIVKFGIVALIKQEIK